MWASLAALIVLGILVSPTQLLLPQFLLFALAQVCYLRYSGSRRVSADGSSRRSSLRPSIFAVPTHAAPKRESLVMNDLEAPYPRSSKTGSPRNSPRSSAYNTTTKLADNRVSSASLGVPPASTQRHSTSSVRLSGSFQDPPPRGPLPMPMPRPLAPAEALLKGPPPYTPASAPHTPGPAYFMPLRDPDAPRNEKRASYHGPSNPVRPRPMSQGPSPGAPPIDRSRSQASRPSSTHSSSSRHSSIAVLAALDELNAMLSAPNLTPEAVRDLKGRIAALQVLAAPPPPPGTVPPEPPVHRRASTLPHPAPPPSGSNEAPPHRTPRKALTHPPGPSRRQSNRRKLKATSKPVS
jgi:hypothetical protein